MNMSLPSVGAWVEIQTPLANSLECSRSLPSVGAWVEMLNTMPSNLTSKVAPFGGSVG